MVEIPDETRSAAEILRELRARDAAWRASQPPRPSVRVSRYTINAVPDGITDADMFAITVEPRSQGWAILRGEHRALGSDGTWSWGYRWQGGDSEPATEAEWDDYHAGYDAWLAERRFDEQTAVKLAEAAAPMVTVMGRTAAQVVAEARAGEGRG